MKLPTNILTFFSGFWVKFGLVMAIIIALLAGGYKVGYMVRDRAALQEQQKTAQQTIKDVNKYKKQIEDLLAKQHDLSSQLDQALLQNQKVVTKYVDRTIVKEIHDHPSDYQCPIPASGMSIIAHQATELNNLRPRLGKNH